MRWTGLFGGLPPSHAEVFRRTHERWLNRALRSAAPVPRIPVRRVDLGGFEDLLSRPRGREIADRWWRMAFARTPDIE